MLALATMLVVSIPAGASVTAQGAAASGNLVVNPRRMAGAVSAQGWDEVTIPVRNYPVALAVTG